MPDRSVVTRRLTVRAVLRYEIRSRPVSNYGPPAATDHLEVGGVHCLRGCRRPIEGLYESRTQYGPGGNKRHGSDGEKRADCELRIPQTNIRLPTV